MRALVTGGAGFIGAYVTKLLLRDGHTVVCFDSLTDGNTLDLILDSPTRASLTVLAGDVGDPLALTRAAADHRVDTIIHLAGMLYAAADRDPPLALRVNAGGVLNALEAARILKLRRVVWASSSTVFGHRSLYPEGIALDSSLHAPLGVYGAMKSLGEQLARHYAERFEVDAIGLRFAVVYGYGRQRGVGGGTDLLRNVALGRPAVAEHADTVMTWIHVEDVARATVMAAAHAGKTRRTFNTGGSLGSTADVAQIARALISNAEVTIEHQALFGIEFPVYDATGIAEEIGFRPQYDLRHGVLLTLNGFRAEAGLPPIG